MSNLILRIPNVPTLGTGDHVRTAPVWAVLRAAANGATERTVGYHTTVHAFTTLDGATGFYLAHHGTAIITAWPTGKVSIRPTERVSVTTMFRINYVLRCARVHASVTRRFRRDGSVAPWYQVRTYDPASSRSLRVADYAGHEVARLVSWPAMGPGFVAVDD